MFARAAPLREVFMGSSQTNLLLYFAILGLAFYFLIIRPQQQRQKQQRALLSSLKVGDRVVTVSGIYGTIASIDADAVMLRVAEGVQFEMAKGAITQIVESFSAQVSPEGREDD
jgi:preprotein translocase subunit YajC